jgi:hypothetical protein
MKRVLLVISTLLLGIYFFGGSCDRLNYDYRQNQAPKVYFVNIPTQDSKFSSDTTIYWYGTDVDGFIDLYRYAVVEASIVNAFSRPDSFLIATPDDQIPWDTIDVTKSDPGTSHDVKMSADISDPVRKYKQSYIFLQAVDNLGAKSEVVYRTFQKNSHYPNTYITAQDVTDPYVNAFTALSGVSLSWKGVDSADWGGNPPPFEFKWKLFGPYTDAEMAQINENYTGEVFLDRFGDIYFDDDTYPIDDTNRVPVTQVSRVHGSWEEILYLDTLRDTIPPRLRTFLPVPSTMLRIVDSSGTPPSDIFTYRDSTPEWTTETSQILYNVFQNSIFNQDTTSQYNFLLWCEARDDSKVIDAIPAFQWISVIDPKFEREIVVLDMTKHDNSNTPTLPNPPAMDTIKSLLGNMINEYGRSILGKDEIFDYTLLPNVNWVRPSDGRVITIAHHFYGTTQDYYPVKTLNDYYQGHGAFISLRDILKHKVVIIFKDDVLGTINLTGSASNPSGYGEMVSVIDGLNAGMSCWSMARDAFADPKPFVPSFCTALSDAYRSYFGVLRVFCEAWYSQIKSEDDGNYERTRRNENFIGADVVNDFKGAFPTLKVDTTLLEERYHWTQAPLNDYIRLVSYPFRWNSCYPPDRVGKMIVGALPEVGYIERSPSSLVKPVYLFKSCYKPANDTSSEYSNLQEVGTYQSIELGDCAIDPGTYTLLIGTDIAYKGRVVAIYTDAYYFRTSHFSFTLLPFDSVQAKQVFYSMMDSMYAAPFIGQTGKIMPPSSAVMKPHRGVNVSELRRITKELHDLRKEQILEARGEIPEF